MAKVSKEKKVEIKVGLDEKSHPNKISWKSDDHPQSKNWTDAKGMFVSFFDAKHLDTYKLDLWTSELQVVEMDRFVYQTIKGMADTYLRATNNVELANDMQKFAQYFGEQTETIPRSKT